MPIFQIVERFFSGGIGDQLAFASGIEKAFPSNAALGGAAIVATGRGRCRAAG